jgi:hypothetical protein
LSSAVVLFAGVESFFALVAVVSAPSDCLTVSTESAVAGIAISPFEGVLVVVVSVDDMFPPQAASKNNKLSKVHFIVLNALNRD